MLFFKLFHGIYSIYNSFVLKDLIGAKGQDVILSN